MKKQKKNFVIKSMVVFVLVMATVITAFPGMEPEAVAKAATVKAVTSVNHNAIKLSEDKLYGFKSAASGWMMNTKGAGKTNGTNINLYPLDLSQPITQLYSVTVVSEKDNIFRLSPSYDDTKFLDVRRYGAAFAEGQKICLWSEDNDPLLLKNLQLEYNPDGSLTLVFAEHPEMCISAASLSAASTYQKQLVVKRKTGAPEERFVLTDEHGMPLNIEQEVTSQLDMQIAFRQYMDRYQVLKGDLDALIVDEEYQDAVTRWKLAQIVNKFSGEYQYFNVSGTSPCYATHRESSHSCDKCYNVNVLNTAWLKKMFNLDINTKWTSSMVEKYLPNQVGTARGWSCWGFGNFCQYILYKNSNQDEVDVTNVKGKFNRSFIEKNARVGDIVRVNGHTLVVYETTPAGMYVVDCNWNTTPLFTKTQLNCRVSLHFLSYSHSVYANKECWVVSVEGEQKQEMIASFTNLVRGYASLFMD